MANRREEGYDNEVRLMISRLDHNASLHAYTAGQNGADQDWHRGGVQADEDLGEIIEQHDGHHPALSAEEQEERLGAALARIRLEAQGRPGWSAEVWRKRQLEPPATAEEAEAYSAR